MTGLLKRRSPAAAAADRGWSIRAAPAPPALAAAANCSQELPCSTSVTLDLELTAEEVRRCRDAWGRGRFEQLPLPQALPLGSALHLRAFPPLQALHNSKRLRPPPSPCVGDVHRAAANACERL